jgi:catechol 2,3-dioxygenase-like lactoylglutathione lyase family enzyme
VKDLCSTVKDKIVWLDRYFDQTVFHRFFTDTLTTAQITLVTLPASAARSNSDRQRVTEFRDVSRLFAAERGPTGYRLIENPDFHDRWSPVARPQTVQSGERAGMRFIYVRGPDGVTIEFIPDAPERLHTTDRTNG